MGHQITRLLDDFNRADEGPPPSASWVASLNGGLQVVSNECAAVIGDEAASWNTLYLADQEFFVTISVPPPTGQYVVVYARLVTATDWNSNQYQIDMIATGGASDTVQFWKRFSGVWTQLGSDISLSPNIAIGDQVGIRLVGTDISAHYNEDNIGSRTDSDITGAGYGGLYISETTARLDDFGGGAFTSLPKRQQPNPAIISR